MLYAINEDGSFRAVSEDMVLFEGESLYDDIPQWVYDGFEANRIKAEKVAAEDVWRMLEVAFISDQLLALEDADPTALPGTESQWRAYRTAVRSWKDGCPYFPEEASRPVRPT